MIVVDASVALRWFLPEPGHEAARAILNQGGLNQPGLVAPARLLLEIASALLRGVRRGGLAEADARTILAEKLPVMLSLRDDQPLFVPAFDLASRFGGSVHDALYVVMTVRDQARLATANEQMRRTATAIGVPVWWVGT